MKFVKQTLKFLPSANWAHQIDHEEETNLSRVSSSRFVLFLLEVKLRGWAFFRPSKVGT